MLSWKPSLQRALSIMGSRPTLCSSSTHLSPHQSVNYSHNEATLFTHMILLTFFSYLRTWLCSVMLSDIRWALFP